VWLIFAVGYGWILVRGLLAHVHIPWYAYSVEALTAYVGLAGVVGRRAVRVRLDNVRLVRTAGRSKLGQIVETTTNIAEFRAVGRLVRRRYWDVALITRDHRPVRLFMALYNRAAVEDAAARLNGMLNECRKGSGDNAL
jgi:hypothetical protein